MEDLTGRLSRCTWKERGTYFSPLYNMTAPCVNDVRRIRSRGCSKMTWHCKNRGADRVLDDNAALARLPFFSHGLESSPACFVRPVSHSIALRRRACLVSSSSVDKGNKNSLDAPPGASTKHPRIVSVPASKGCAVMVTGWYEFAGTTNAVGFDSIDTPDVLLTCKHRYIPIVN